MSDPRPLSPHITIYRPQISSVLSILHRITGVWLSLGAALLVAWLYTVAYAPEFHPGMYECLSSFFGKLFLFSWAFCFYFHLCSGIRHLFWDIGMGFSLPRMHLTGWMVVIFSFLFTLLTWGFVGSLAE